MRKVILKKPCFNRDKIVGTKSALRPFRKSGIRLEKEIIKDKLIVHNYGYAGSGITLSFGGAAQVASMVEGKQIGVLGAGVIGLTCAYELILKGYTVTIYAENFSPHLTSDVAAGIWTPPDQGAYGEMLSKSKESFQVYEFQGVMFLDYYVFGLPPLFDEEVVEVEFEGGVKKNGLRYNEIAIDGKIFMADLFKKVKESATFSQRKFSCLDEVLALKEEVIINCTSLGSKELFGDQDLYPVRGVLLYFPAQAINYTIYSPISEDYFLSIFPWKDRLILGGVYDKGESTDLIIERLLNHAENFLKD
jgi:hypothetical protein